ncbi:cell division protein FtsK [Streptomyces sp. NPDC001435]|uniref:cell division protein FtsK n=1 Tax=Streptomyces sp. NPDC001435 TaxID=3364576 RepID=UPI0036BBD759
MNHPDDNELFNRLEAEMAADSHPDSGGEVVDLDKARSARSESADPNAGPDADRSPDSHTDESPDPATPVMVDQSATAATGPGYLGRLAAAKRRDVIPLWLRSTAELRTAARWVARHYTHTAGYHAVRSPVYAARLTMQAPTGLARFLGGTLRWVADREGEPVRLAAVRREDAAEYLKLSRQRDGRVRLRTLVAVLAMFVGVGSALAIYVLAPDWLQALSVGALVLALGYNGRQADSPVIHRAVEVPKASKLTSDIVLRALGAIGIPAINQAQAKGRDGFEFTAPITRDGPGWRAEGNLPFGVTVTDVIEKRERLASGLRRPLGCVWPEAESEEHPGHLVLWVGDQTLKAAPKPTWPLLKSGTVDLFQAIPYGTDQRGRWAEVTLMFIAGIIGAIPRMGKTFLLRLLLLIAALDPRAELHTYDMKGTGDLDPVGEAVSHRHGVGEEDETILYALADFRALREELRRRTKVIRSLPRDICPESKVTSQLADKRSLGLHPIIIGVDECQVLFEHAEHGKEFEAIATDLVKRGPATGIVLLLATQRPDAKSLPTGISANASTRFCLKVMGQTENDMVLGTSSYKRGVRATMFAWGDKGLHYFVGEGSDARIVSSTFLDAPMAERVAARARTIREKLGRLSGYALGEAPEVVTGPSYDLLADVAVVVPSLEERVWNERIAARLAELRPDVYGGWKGENVTSALKPHGIRTRDVAGTTDDGTRTTRRGIVRADLLKAIAERNQNPGAA